ncbi:MAG: class I SAM-dependent methyltransferase [Eubacteriaceae bacterium]|nr:class I SAM-dependent methyltransferase [Eubacteriaceae bacterium]
MMDDINKSSDDSLIAWETNADFWDERMGDASNAFHREVVRPQTELLLDVHAGDLVLEAACGNGNYARRLAQQGARVVAFDFSGKMIENARKRQAEYLRMIDFHVCDARDYHRIKSLGSDASFDKAVCNMAVMDISDIKPLFQAVFALLKDGGVFVFSTHHPCFERPADNYMTGKMHKGEAINGQPMLQNYYHRSMQEIFSCCFGSGFVIDGFYEQPDSDPELPVIMIVRLRKPQK